MIRTERKYIEILRILKEHREPVGAKRLSELMAERGFILSDRAVQYYLSYLDAMGFTEKVGNQGRILTPAGFQETDNALVDDRIGFVISKLERLAYRSTFDPASGTGDVSLVSRPHLMRLRKRDVVSSRRIASLIMIRGFRMVLPGLSPSVAYRWMVFFKGMGFR
jgi:repressor of nif and glnA expression